MVWHGLGGTADQTADGYFGRGPSYQGLWGQSDGRAIFVAGQGLSANGGGAGWPNSGGRDIAFVRAMLAKLKSDYCIDETRVFSTGISYGGIMSNTVGCQLGDQVRAIAPIMGNGPCSFFGCAGCTGQVAAWLTHGSADAIVSYASGQASRDHWKEANGCADTSVVTGIDACVEYNGCDEGYPVVWCPTSLGHSTPAFAPSSIWEFFDRF